MKGWLVILSVCVCLGTAHGQMEDWTLDVRLLSSISAGRPPLGEGTGVEWPSVGGHRRRPSGPLGPARNPELWRFRAPQVG